MSRKKLIAGNWKMNTTLPEAVHLAKGLQVSIGTLTDVDIAICPPYISIATVAEILKGSTIKVGAQDVHWDKNGAFTGKICCGMLKSVGVEYVIIGHSEQRSYFNETDFTVNKKTQALLVNNLLPIICIGETLEERNNGAMTKVVEKQIRGAFKDISKGNALHCTIAYEPVWAIGTGVTATPQEANEAHQFVRSVIASLYDTDCAEGMRVLYGGSMNPANAYELLSKTDVDGGLIGGAALKVDTFTNIVKPQKKVEV